MRIILTVVLAMTLMGTSPPVKGQDPAKIEDAPKIFLRFFKLEKEDQQRTKAITQILIKRKSSLEKKMQTLSKEEKLEHQELKRDVAIWEAGYNVYKMTENEKALAYKVLFKK